jgi:hypothetical protein
MNILMKHKLCECIEMREKIHNFWGFAETTLQYPLIFVGIIAFPYSWIELFHA